MIDDLIKKYEDELTPKEDENDVSLPIFMVDLKIKQFIQDLKELKNSQNNFITKLNTCMCNQKYLKGFNNCKKEIKNELIGKND